MTCKPGYYNENNPRAAAWLRKLIAAKLIAPGEVDERSILDVRADDLAGFGQCHFFAGIGGWSLALRLAGVPDDYPAWTGSCPCQPFSQLGARRGTADDRHLWPVWRALIGQCRPAIVFGEQVARGGGPEWLAGVRDDLEAHGYAVGIADLPACCVTAPQKRERLWFVAMGGAESLGRGKDVGALESSRGGRQTAGWIPFAGEIVLGADGTRRRVESGSFTLGHGIPGRVEQLRGYGNAIVPQVAATFIQAAMNFAERYEHREN